MKKVLTPALLATMALASCSTTKTVYQDYSSLKLAKPPVAARPVVADLEVGSKTTFTRSYINATPAFAKETAMAEFCKEYKCDIVVNPQFALEMEQKGSQKKGETGDVKVNLTAFPGTYKNIHSYEPKDSLYFNNNVLRWVAPETSYDQTGATDKPKHKSHKGKIIGGAALVALVVLLALL